jgi:hypothetical protein
MNNQASNFRRAALNKVAQDTQYTLLVLQNMVTAAAEVLQRDYGWSVEQSAEFAKKMITQANQNLDEIKAKRK